MQEMWEMQIWSLGREDPLEEEMAIYSTILAWEIPWTEEPGGLQSIRLQRVGQNWTNLENTHAQYLSPQLVNKILGISSTFTGNTLCLSSLFSLDFYSIPLNIVIEFNIHFSF